MDEAKKWKISKKEWKVINRRTDKRLVLDARKFQGSGITAVIQIAMAICLGIVYTNYSSLFGKHFFGEEFFSEKNPWQSF